MTQKMKDGHIQIGNTKVAVQDANGNFRDMTDIIADVTKATDGMGDAEKTAALQSTFTADSIKAMGILCNTGADDIDKFTKSLENSKGSAQKMSDMMNNTLSGSIKKLGSMWEYTANTLGDTTGPLSLIIGLLTKAVEAFSKLPGPVKQFIITLALIGAAIGPVLQIAGKAITVFLKVKEAVGLISTAVGLFGLKIGPMLTGAFRAVSSFVTGSVIPALKGLWGVLMGNPIILIIAAIAALVAGFIYLWNNCEGFRQFWIGLWEDIKSSCGPAIEGIKQAFKNIVPQIMEIWNGLGDFFKGFGELLKGIINGDWQQIFDGLTQMGEAWHNICVALWTAIGNLVMSALQGLWQWIINLGSSFLSWLGGILNNLLTTVTQGVSNIVNAIVSFFSNLPATIWYWLCFVISYVALWTAQMIQKGIEAGTQFVTNVINWIQQLPGRIWTWLVDTVTKVQTWASQMVSKAQQAGSQFLQRVSTYIQQLPGRIWSFLSNAISKAVTFASQFPAKAQQAGSRFLQKVVSFIQQLPGRVWSFLSQTIQKAISFATQFAQKGMQAAKNFASKIKSGLANLPGQMVTIGKNIIDGIVRGVTNGASALFNAMKNIASKAVNAAKSALGIKSPSRVFAKEVGKYIPEGVSVGIQANTDSAIDSVKKLANSLVASVDMNNLSKSMKLATSGIDIDTTNNYDNNNMIGTMRQLINEVQSIKFEFDYKKMGEQMKEAVSCQNSVVYMDSDIVGKKVAKPVKEYNDFTMNRLSRFRGDKDDL